MTMEPEVRTGLPSEQEILALLNEAYSGWGNYEYFRWKYNEFPDYDPSNHVFYIRSDAELAAFRRIFHKEVTAGPETSRVDVLGDTAVGTDHRGQGFYSSLHSRTMEYSERNDATRAVTYNRKGNITFEANLDRGWRFRELPLRIRILSPSIVLKQYAELVVDDLPMLERIADVVGQRFHVTTSDGNVNLHELVGTGDVHTGTRSIGPTLSDRAITRLVETASASEKGVFELGVQGVRLVASGDVGLWQGGDTGDKFGSGSNRSSNITVTRQREVTDKEIEELHGLYDRSNPSFRRAREDIRHLTRYPGCEILITKRNRSVTGYAVLSPRENDGIIEGRVLELQTDGNDEYGVLINEIEQASIDRGFDLILLLSERSPGELWASIDKQVIMWTDFEQNESCPLDRDDCRISLYDVL